jgi:hypothetical protein
VLAARYIGVRPPSATTTARDATALDSGSCSNEGGFMSGFSLANPRRYHAVARASLRLSVAAVAGLLALSAPAQARRRDQTPPVFGGVKSATTCVPGPVGPGRTSTYHLSWAPATDNVTRSKRIVYEVYQATMPGGEDFSAPTYTTRRGATTFDTPLLPTDQNFYFVVRARDRAGNEESNTIEQEGQNLCV